MDCFSLLVGTLIGFVVGIVVGGISYDFDTALKLSKKSYRVEWCDLSVCDPQLCRNMRKENLK